MEEIKEVQGIMLSSNGKEKTILYETPDGKRFPNRQGAEKYMRYTALNKEINSRIKNVSLNEEYYLEDEYNLINNKAYYIENIDDFKVIVEYLFLTDRFTETDYRGKDWYFFYSDYNDYYDNEDKKYWIETLTEKKQKWEEYYKQFK